MGEAFVSMLAGLLPRQVSLFDATCLRVFMPIGYLLSFSDCEYLFFSDACCFNFVFVHKDQFKVKMEHMVDITSMFYRSWVHRARNRTAGTQESI